MPVLLYMEESNGKLEITTNCATLYKIILLSKNLTKQYQHNLSMPLPIRHVASKILDIFTVDDIAI